MAEANLFAWVVKDVLGDVCLFPAGEVPVDGLPGWKICRELSPGTAGAHEVEDGVHDRPAGVLLGTTTELGW